MVKVSEDDELWDMLILRFLWNLQIKMSGRQVDVWSVAPNKVWEASEGSENRIHRAG